MARMRIVKPSFFTNEILCSLPPLTRLLFEGLWCYADREGRLEDRPRRLKTEILPYDDCNVDAMLDDLHSTTDHDGEPFITRYDAGGIRYIQITKFTRHQTPHCKESASVIPAQGQHCANTVLAPLGNGDLSLGNGDLGVGNGAYATLEQVKVYAKAYGRPEEAEKYYNHRASVGWHKNRQPIIDWQADFRHWCSNSYAVTVDLPQPKKREDMRAADKNLKGIIPDA